MTSQPDMSTTMLQRAFQFALAQPARATETVKAARAHPTMPWIAWPVSIIAIGVTFALYFKFPPTSKLDWTGKSVPGAFGILINPVFVDLMVYSAETLLSVFGRIVAAWRGTPPSPPSA